MSYIDKIEIETKICLKNFIARITLSKFVGFMEKSNQIKFQTILVSNP